MFGPIYCTVSSFISYVTVAASVFTLVAITCERRKGIMRPLEVDRYNLVLPTV